jgi:hypothetical protein
MDNGSLSQSTSPDTWMVFDLYDAEGLEGMVFQSLFDLKDCVVKRARCFGLNPHHADCRVLLASSEAGSFQTSNIGRLGVGGGHENVGFGHLHAGCIKAD